MNYKIFNYIFNILLKYINNNYYFIITKIKNIYIYFNYSFFIYLLYNNLN